MSDKKTTCTLGTTFFAIALVALILNVNACTTTEESVSDPVTDAQSKEVFEAERKQARVHREEETGRKEKPELSRTATSRKSSDSANKEMPELTRVATPHKSSDEANSEFAPLPRLRGLGYAAEGQFASPPSQPTFNTEQYDAIVDKGFLDPIHDPLSTFSIDVDTASYSNVRRILKDGMLPPSGAVRIEELVNYFSYDYPAADHGEPVSVMSETSQAPWAPKHRLVMVGLKGVEFEEEQVPPRNLTFLLDVSGSMQSPDKLGLVVGAMKGLANTLRPEDHVAIVVYAGASGLVLPSTSGSERGTIRDALDRLRAGGSTNGGEGIRLAYKVARQNFDSEGINRVILASDGDFNVGTTNRSELRKLIKEERKSGVFLTVLGVGTGNLKDATMEELADHGNGNYAYLDSIGEARKVLIRESGSTLVTVAKDVKIQVEFNPARVAGYRLIGYSNRRLADRDFNDDKKDAGELGAGHSVTALYEVIPHGVETRRRQVDPLRYQRPAQHASIVAENYDTSDELLTIKVRYKLPDEDESRLITRHSHGESAPIHEASEDLRFAAAVASFGMLLRDSPYGGDANWNLTSDLARDALGRDPHGDRAEFLYLVSEARELKEGMGS